MKTFLITKLVQIDNVFEVVAVVNFGDNFRFDFQLG